MKKIYFLLSAGLLMFSCSSDDSANTPSAGNDVATADFLPLTTGNYWVYDVESATQTGRDSLYIAGDITANGNTYKRFTTLNLPTGLFSNSVYNDGIRKQGDRLLLNGTFELGFAGEIPLNIPVTDFTIFKENAGNNQQIGATSGSVVQPYNGYDITFNYTLSTRFVQSHASFTVGSQTYTNVKQIQTIINLSITTVVPLGNTPFVATIMQSQNVVVANQYYAAGIGVVRTSSDITYQLQDFSLIGASLPIPQSGAEHQEETLNHYSAD